MNPRRAASLRASRVIGSWVLTLLASVGVASLSSLGEVLLLAWALWMLFEGLRWAVRRMRQRRTFDRTR